MRNRRRLRNVVPCRPPEFDLISANPYSWIEADNVSTSGGKVTQFTDKVPSGAGIRAVTASHAFAQGNSTYQVATPASDALFGGRLSAVFSAHYYVSNAPASAWRCLHDGTGCAIYLLCSFSNVTGTKYVLATANNSSSTGAQITMVGAVNQYVAFKASGAATVVNPITVSVNATSTAYSIVAGYASANTPDADIQRSWSTEGSGNESTSPDAGDPAASLYFGNRPAVTAAFTGSLASMIIFNRARTTALDQIVRAYFAKRFRVTT